MPQVGPLKIKIQVLCGGEFAMGPGKAALLEAIDRDGSISAAGRAIGMSYRRAWLLVDTMNRCWTHTLVEATAGGGQQRGARLTPAGRDVLAAYRALEAHVAEAAAGNIASKLATGLLKSQRAARPATRSREDAG